MKKPENLKDFVNSPHNAYMTDDELITTFLMRNPVILNIVLPPLANFMAKRCISLEHKCDVKDEYLVCVQDWLKGDIHKDKQFHPELKDKMIENINKALDVKGAIE